jgi:predicted amidophosphoribosyltransferase
MCAGEKFVELSQERCLVCDLPFPPGESICKNIICSWNDKWFTWNYAVAMRTGQLQRAINRYKFHNREHWAVIFARVLVGFMQSEHDLFRSFDLIVANPTYVSQQQDARHWDHTRRVIYKAHEACYGDWPFDVDPVAAIIKTRKTTQMSSVRGWKARRQIAETELRRALKVPNPERIAGKRILVYDDIFTIGFTLREVARTLILQGGATEVCGVSLARQPW